MAEDLRQQKQSWIFCFFDFLSSVKKFPENIKMK